MTKSMGTLDRREFMVRGVAAAALAACPPAVRSLVAEGLRAPHVFSTVLFDRNSADAAAFADEAARHGARTLGVGLDVGPAWMNEIAPLWRSGRGAIAGLTAGVPLFCLELLARDYGMRLAYRAEHRAITSGRFRHHITNPAGTSRIWERELTAAGSGWGIVAARLALSRNDVPLQGSIGLLDLEDGRGADGTLFSWVIAPGNVERGVAVISNASCSS